jgi:hypothetical protein
MATPRPEKLAAPDAAARVRSFLRHRVIARYHPSAFLLGVQLLSLILYPALDDVASGRALLRAFGILVLALAVWVVTRSPAANWIAWTLAIPAFLLSLVPAVLGQPGLAPWSSLLVALLYFYAAASLIAYMMADWRVTVDELFAAGAAFTLIAWGFAHTYLVCLSWFPGSFTVGDAARPPTFFELLFLSFTNLSATGLGDLLPRTSQARVLVMLQQFTGVAYLAVVVSRLIGLTIVRGESRRT